MHDLLGMATFGLGVLLALSGDHFLRYLRPTADQSVGPEMQPRVGKKQTASAIDRPLTPKATLIIVGVTMLVGLSAGVLYGKGGQLKLSTLSMEEMAEIAAIDVRTLEQNALPATIADWTVIGFQSEQRDSDSVFGGLVSATWQLNNGNRSVLFSIDGPYNNWHNLGVCYRAIGWTIDDSDTVVVSELSDFSSFEMSVSKPPLDEGQVIFGCIDPNGGCVPPPPTYFGNAALRFFQRMGTGVRDQADFRGGVTQFQLLDQRPFRITEKQREENRVLYDALVTYTVNNLIREQP